MQAIPSRVPNVRIRIATWAVLALSFALRAILVFRGGQLFWPDEDRFEIARKTAHALFDLRLAEAADLLWGHPDHILFKILGLVPAGLEVGAGAPGWVSGLFFAAISTWVLWLIPRVARAAGANETEGFIALILAACACSLFYYSRHFFPYDLALGLLLLALTHGLSGTTSRRASFMTGCYTGLGYLAYNGYWALGALILATHVLRALTDLRAAATRFTYGLLGLVFPVFGVAVASQLNGYDFFALTLAFADTANQGELDQVWTFVPQYLWLTEHGLSIMWALCLIAAFIPARRFFEPHRMIWPVLVVVLASMLILPPFLWHHFALTARHVRVLVPFLCLTSASLIYANRFLRNRPRVMAVILGMLLVQTAYNFANPLIQIFPREFEAIAIKRLAEARKTDLGPYKIVNASFLHNPNWAPLEPDHGKVLFRRAHPFQFTPYLYEGYSGKIRENYLKRDLSMRVVRLDAGGPPISGYPAGMLELLLRFPLHPESLLPEPLLSTGSPGSGDTLFLRYEGPDHFVLGHDHIGGGATYSPRMPLDRTKVHRVLIGMDNLYAPDALDKKTQRFVVWNDTVLLHGPAELHVTSPDQIDIGHNFIGSSTSIAQLSADILSFRHIQPPKAGMIFKQPPGALLLEMLLPPDIAPGHAEPILSSGQPEQGDLLFLRRYFDGRYRLGHDHWGAGATLSEPFRLDMKQSLKLVVGFGPFIPGANGGTSSKTRQRWLYASCNDRIIFNRITAYHPSAGNDLVFGENHALSTAVSDPLSAEVLSCEPVSLENITPMFSNPRGAVKLALRFFGAITKGRADPILSTGKTGAGDLLFIRFDGDGHYQIGHDHWGAALTLSPPQKFDPSQPIELTIAIGPLLKASHAYARFQNRLFVTANDKVILNQPATFHEAAPSTVSFGANGIGASTAAEVLSADILNFTVLDPMTLLPFLDHSDDMP